LHVNKISTKQSLNLPSFCEFCDHVTLPKNGLFLILPKLDGDVTYLKQLEEIRRTNFEERKRLAHKYGNKKEGNPLNLFNS
jgi:hypothetical protein